MYMYLYDCNKHSLGLIGNRENEPKFDLSTKTVEEVENIALKNK